MKILKRMVALSLLPLLLAVPTLHAGQLTILFFHGIEGTAVANLTDDPFFPEFPTDIEILPQPGSTLLEWIDAGANDNVGTYTQGYLEAPLSGEYQFYIASDDASELWLSSDHNPVNRAAGDPIAFELQCCTGTPTSADGLFDGARLEQRRSAPINLVRGNKYYFEVLHKEGAGGAWWRLGWDRPDGVQEQIPIRVAMPFAPDAPLSIDANPAAITVSEPSPATFSVDVTAQQPATFQWLRNGSPIDGAILSHYTVTETTLAMNGDRYSVRVTDATGASQTSAAATLTVTVDVVPPEAVFAVTGGNLNEITVGFSERVAAALAENIANYSVDQGVTVQSAELSVDGTSVLLKVSSLNLLTGYNITVKDITDIAQNPNTMSPNPTTLVVILFDIFDFDQTAEGPWSDIEHTTATAPKVPNNSIVLDGNITPEEYGGFAGTTVIGGIHGHINAWPPDRSWNNPADSSFVFYLAHDDTWVYVAVDVKDDIVNSDDGPREFWKDDAIEIVVDVQNDDYDVNTDSSADPYGGHLYFNYLGKISDTEYPAGVKDGGTQRWATAVDWTYGEDGDMFGFGKEVPGGWRTEMRFHKRLFEDPALGNKLDDGFVMGFNIGIDDDDKRGPGLNGDGTRSQDLEIQYFWANRLRRQGLNAAYVASGAPIEALPLIINSDGRISHGGAGDIIFAAAGVDAPVLNPPTREGDNIVITWTGAGALQKAPTVNGPWSAAAPNSPYSVVPSEQAEFYRVSQ